MIINKMIWWLWVKMILWEMLQKKKWNIKSITKMNKKKDINQRVINLSNRIQMKETTRKISLCKLKIWEEINHILLLSLEILFQFKAFKALSTFNGHFLFSLNWFTVIETTVNTSPNLNGRKMMIVADLNLDDYLMHFTS